VGSRPAVGVEDTTRDIGTLAVVQPPTMSPLPSVRHGIGTSRMIDVTFASASESWVAVSAAALSSTAGYLMLTRSNVSPRLTTKGSLRCPTNTRPTPEQPGIEMSHTCLFAYAM
jgi:hypothetical protein